MVASSYRRPHGALTYLPERSRFIKRIFVASPPQSRPWRGRDPSFQVEGDGSIERSRSIKADRSEPLRDQREAVFSRSIAQLLVPAGELEGFASGEGEGAGKVDGVVGA
jgi:hypothetical protein